MTTTIPAADTPTYLPDRYDRLRKAAEIFATDPNVANAGPLVNGEALLAFISTLADEGVLDGLTEHDADTVSMLVTLDFLRGPRRLVWRIESWWLGGDRPGDREDDDTFAVCAVLAEAVRLLLAGFASAEFLEARANTRWPGRSGATE